MTFVPNPEQQAVINAIYGTTVVVSGPGSGKTSTLIERFKNMLSVGIPTSEILNLTFTASAAETMVKKSGFLDDKTIFRTFHSFAMELLRKERQHLPFKLIEYTAENGEVTVPVIPVYGEEYQLLFDLVKSYPAIKSFRTLKERISGWKRDNIEPAQAIAEARGIEYFEAMAYQDYEDRCREAGWLDFDSLMREAVLLLERNEEVRNRWHRKFIGTDEGQDTDSVQFKLLQLIFNGNIIIVGDENQCVFEWRSAKPGSLTNFGKSFTGANKLYLGQNYRSTKRIVKFLKEILPVDNGIASHMFTENEEGEDPTFTRYFDDVEEADQVLRSITDPVKTAIIARTNRQLFIYQRACTAKEIKYRILGKKDFWEQNEVKKLLALAKDSKDVRSASEVLSDLIQRHNLLNIYRDAGNPLESNPIENLNSLVKLAANRGTIAEFLTWLRKLTYARKAKGDKGLTLSTVHQAKGKEWDYVYVVGVSQGKLPHKDGEINEEKRIFFVACSRAAKHLGISWSGPKSEFLNNLSQEYKDTFKEYKLPVIEGFEEE